MTSKGVYIIAEIGPNHNGSFNIAKKMIKELNNSGVNAIKFQIADPNLVYSDDSFFANYQKKSGAKSIKQMSIKNQLTYKEHLKLSNLCKRFNIDYLCSAFDLKSLKFLITKIKVKKIKIPSGEITSIDLLEYLSKKKNEILLSTGMSNLYEISKAIEKLNKNFKKNITLLHCVSEYPAKKKNLNINLVKKLKEFFRLKVGYSDHSIGSEACLAAVAAGACVIEKHITLSRKLKGPDHRSSMEINQFKKLIKKIRELEIIMGTSKKNISVEENEIKRVSRKSIVTKTFLRKGTVLKKRHLCFKRPGTGISPMNYNKVIGKKILRDIKQNKILKLNNLK